MMNELAHKFIVMDITKDYCTGNATIEDVKNKFDEFTEQMNKEESYTECIGKVSANIELLSSIICMKKLKENRNDLYTIILLLERELENLKVICTEVN